jgi:hypothetical protein
MLMAKARSLPYLDINVPNRENACLIIQARLDELYLWEPYVDNPEAIVELHNLRIAAKRLRYSLEIFEDVLPAESAVLRAEVEQIQEELGAWHDSDVLCTLLRLCLAPGSAGGNSGVAILQEMWEKNLVLPPSLLRTVLDPQTLPSDEERSGLELLLDDIIHARDEQYETFHRHWQKLEARDYRRAVEGLLDIRAVV